MKKEILEKQKFGSLTTIKYMKDLRPPKWKCRCSCGKITYVSTRDLNSGNTKSCGCKSKKNKPQKKCVSKDPYYMRWKYYNNNDKYPTFKTLNEFKRWYLKHKNLKFKTTKNIITKRLRNQWNNCVSKNQTGVFKDLYDYCSWAYNHGYIEGIHTLHRKNKNKPHSKRNSEFGFFYKSKFISVKKFNSYHFKFDKNKKQFYGYIKYKGITKFTDKYDNFQDMLNEYSYLYKLLFKSDFLLT